MYIIAQVKQGRGNSATLLFLNFIRVAPINVLV